jgi:cytochrome c biogenesis protein CcmG/thiol:disulfide interchange protein DsbE
MVFKLLMIPLWVRVVFLSLFLLGMAASPPLVGGPAPPFNLKTFEGQTINLSDFKGRFVVLNFWATWCVPCIKEIPEFQKAHQSLSPKVQIIGINLAESKEKVGEFVEINRLSFPVLLDEYGNVSQEYEVIHLPVTYFITPDGIIRDKIFGGGITQKMIEARINQLN